MLGSTMGSYEITDRVGEGGMGAVYIGRHALLGRTAAIKVLHPELSHQPEIVERFFNEARSASAIRHPAIVEIFDFGYADDGSAYIVMEHLAGESLRERLDHALTLDPVRAAGIARQLASALQAAHDQAIIHRDLKPDNVFLVPDAEVAGGERVKILDFGIAKLAANKAASFRTQTGQLFGTPAYMSPEQCRGAGQVDHRADLYAVGCILYEMVCGRPPFVGEGGGEVIAAQIYEEPAAPSELAPHVPPALEAVILRLLDKDAEARFSTGTELATALRSEGGATGTFEPPSSPHVTPTPAPVPAVNTPAGASGTTGQRISGEFRTTLASAASATLSSPPELPDAQGRRRRTVGLALGAAGVVAAAAVAIAVVMHEGSSAAEPTAGRAADAAPAAEPTVSELAPPDAARPAGKAAVDKGARAEPERVVIHIESEPSGAAVFELPHDEPAGTTPFEHETEPSDEIVEFELRKAGHVAEVIEVTPENDSEHAVELKRRPRRPQQQPQRPTQQQIQRPHGESSGPAQQEAPAPAEQGAAPQPGASDAPAEDEDDVADDADADRAPQDSGDQPLNPFERDRDQEESEILDPFER